MKLRTISQGGSTDLDNEQTTFQQGVVITQNREDLSKNRRQTQIFRNRVKSPLENHNFFDPSLLIPNSYVLIYNALIQAVRVVLPGATEQLLIQNVITEKLFKFFSL